MGLPLTALAKGLVGHWLPGADVKTAPDRAAGALLVWRGPRGTVRYLLEFQKHLPQQDVQVLARRLELRRRGLPATKPATKALLLAPYIPPRQAEFLRARGIDYADEAGNAHLDAPGALVHVEGKRPDRAMPPRGAMTKAWVRVVLAGLLDPALFEGPYHRLAAAAGVTAPTVMTCLRDLQGRGLLDARGRRRRLVGGKALLPLWTQAYVNLLRPRLPERRFHLLNAGDHDGTLQRLHAVFAAHGVEWCLTGAAAALRLAHHYHTDIIEIYAAPRAITDTIARELKAQPTTGEANLIVIEPPIPTLVPRERLTHTAPPMAPPLLAYAELRYHATEHANEAAELLLPLIESRHAATA